MKEIYTVPESERENIQKMISRYQKKADVYGQPLTAEYGDPYATEISVYHTARNEHGARVQEKTGTMTVEVFDLTIESEIIRRDGYEVIAKIEHLEGGNVVYNFTEETRQEWSNIPPKCQHCGGSHGQKITFIVRNAEGEEKQVGRNCLKDYCGIDPQHIGALNQLTDMFIDLEADRYDFCEHPAAKAFDTINIIALALRAYKTRGYRSSKDGYDSNKEHMLKEVNDPHITNDERAEAKELATKIMKVELPMANKYLLENVQMLIRNGYCKKSHFGYIAYAPLAYERYHEAKVREEKYQAEKDAERKASEYVGAIGQRIVVDVAEIKLITSWTGEYGFTYMYKITDVSGNIMIWYASKTIGHSSKIKATIKRYSEYNGIKQTVVTRCAIPKEK